MGKPEIQAGLIKTAYDAVKKHGNIAEAARALNVPRKTLSDRYHLYAAEWGTTKVQEWTYPERIELELKNATVLVGGDCHFWPGQTSLIWEAFVEVAHALKPDVTVINGDAFDGTRVSRHPRMRSQNTPKLSEEVGETDRQLARLPKNRRVWTLGNHCQRFDKYLAENASEMEDMATSLPALFPEWEFAYAAMINEYLPHVIPLEIRHFYRMGNHARWNNAMYSGIHTCTNHTHGLGVTPFNNRMGRIYGIETGMLNSHDNPQFEYGQGMQSRAHSGFAFLTFDDQGQLMPPELCELVHGKAWFRNHSWASGEKPRFRVPAGRAA